MGQQITEAVVELLHERVLSEGLSERNLCLGGGVESSKFGFSGGKHDKFHDLGYR